LRDHPNKQINVHPKEPEQTQPNLEEARQAEFERMLAGKGKQVPL